MMLPVIVSPRNYQFASSMPNIDDRTFSIVCVLASRFIGIRVDHFRQMSISSISCYQYTSSILHNALVLTALTEFTCAFIAKPCFDLEVHRAEQNPYFLVNKMLIHDLLHCCVMFSNESMLQQSVPEPRCMCSQFLHQYVRVSLSGRMDRYHMQHASVKFYLRLHFICYALFICYYCSFVCHLFVQFMLLCLPHAMDKCSRYKN